MINRRLTYMLLVAFALLQAGCGYLMEGTWEDDPKNWKRAFDSTKPDDVIVVHSKYWRSPHWTNEFQYFFEFAPNTKLKEQLFTKNRLRRITGDEAAKAKANAFGDAPAWFAPKGVAEYDLWVFENEPDRNLKILIDRNSAATFVSDYSV